MKRPGRREVRRQHREGAPGRREPQAAVEPASEQLEVIRHDEKGADGDEDEQPERARYGDRDADRGGGGDRDGREGGEHSRWNACLQRPAPHLVESVGAGLFAGLLASGSRKKLKKGKSPVESGLRRLREAAQRCEALEISAALDGRDISGRYLLLEAVNLPYVGPNLHLAHDRKHIGRKPCVEQHRVVDLLSRRKGLGFVEDAR